ncbi:aldo/keto reductase [candidate division KSB1 bacterium]|nr:aldo/keto reductase [candidate division KSB1 bacterium]
MNKIPSTTLNNGLEMPWLGLGVFMANEGKEVEQAVNWALDAGYTAIDTAAIYGNEKGVGKAIKESGVARKELFVTTKIWNNDLREQNVLGAFETSLQRLDMDYVDLLLIHWPVAGHFVKAWNVFEEIYDSGRAKAIGVSNFHQHHLETLLEQAEITPAVNQVEFHPYLVQKDLVHFCREKAIQFQAWSPLMKGDFINIDSLKKLAKKVDKTPAQIVLRWHYQHRIITIPKSVHKNRIAENMQVFDFELNDQEMDQIDALNRDKHYGPHPDHFNF